MIKDAHIDPRAILALLGSLPDPDPEEEKRTLELYRSEKAKTYQEGQEEEAE